MGRVGISGYARSVQSESFRIELAPLTNLIIIKPMDLEHCIDFREEAFHKKSLFCVCNPIRIGNSVLHNKFDQYPTAKEVILRTTASELNNVKGD